MPDSITADLAEAVHEGAAEPQFSHASLQFAGSQVGGLHRQRRQTSKSLRLTLNLLGEKVVRPPCYFAGLVLIGYRLHGRSIQGKQHHLDAVGIHLPQPTVLDVKQPCLQFRPVRLGGKPGAVLERLLDREMLFESDFSMHRRGLHLVLCLTGLDKTAP